MKKLVLLFAILFAGSFLAQGQRVSDAAIAVMRSGKMYFKTPMMEYAVKDGVSLGRVSVYGMKMVTLGTGSYSYMLDEQKHTYQSFPNQQQPIGGDIRFVRQGSCRVDGQDGWYFDEYQDAAGQPITFFYNSDKVAILELGTTEAANADDRGLGPMWLHTLQAAIPDHMFLCLTPEWKAQRPGAPAPPTCAKPWKDPAAVNNLACGTGSAAPVITDKQTLAQPLEVASLGVSVPTEAGRSDLNVTQEGVQQALLKIKAVIDTLPDSQVESYLLLFNNDAMSAFRAGCVTGDVVEDVIASSIAYPSALTLNNAGVLFLYMDDAATALPYFEAANKLAPDNPTVLSNLAEAYLEKEDLANAERYANQCLAIAPEFGAALQTLTTIRFAQGRTIAAVPLLLKTAPSYFTEITASQFRSVWMAIQEVAAMGVAGREVGYIFDKIYTKEFFTLLTVATKAGFDHHYVEMTQSPTTYPWPVHSSVEFSWKYYKRCADKADLQRRQWADKAVEARKDKRSLMDLYVAMAGGNLVSDMENLEKMLQGEVGARSRRAKVDITSYLPNQEALDNAYGFLSKDYAGDDDAQYLYDARQYWCLMLWKQYFELSLKYQDGGLCAYGKGAITGGYYPQHYRALLDKMDALDIDHKRVDNTRENLNDQASEKMVNELQALKKKQASMSSEKFQAEAKKIEMEYLKRYCEILKAWYGQKCEIELVRMRTYKEYYTAHYQPLIEDYWKTMAKMVVWCESPYLRDYFLYETAAENMGFAERPFEQAYSCGSQMWTWRQEYIEIKKAIGEDVQELEKEVNDLEEYAAQEVARANGAQKLPYDLSSGYNGHTREVKFTLTKDGKFKITLKNKSTGREDVYNLTDAKHTCKEVYVVTPAEKAKAQQRAAQVRDNVRDFLSGKAMGFIIGKLPGGEMIKSALGAPDVVNNFHTVSSERQRYILSDGAGNILGTRKVVESSTTHNFSANGYTVSITRQEGEYLSGSCKVQQRHLRLSKGATFLEVSR